MYTWTRQWLLGLCATTALLSVGHSVEGFSASVKAMGMGGAAVAFPQDSLTTVYNPATATGLCCRWDLGFSWYYDHKSLTVSNRTVISGAAETATGRYTSKTNQLLPEFGINSWCNDCLAVGLSLNNYAYINTRYKQGVNVYNGDLIPGAGTRARFQYQIGLLTATAAYRFACHHAVGLGLNWYFGRFKVDGLDRFNGNGLIAFSADPGFLTNQGYDYTNGVGVTLGYYGHWFDCLSVGASFSPKVYMREFNRYKGLLANERLDIPLTWRVGVAYDWNPCLVLAADFEMRQYRDTPSWHNPSFNSANFPGFFAELPNQFGTINGPGFDWRNQWMLKLGADYKWNECWVLRAGYRHESSLFKANRTASFLNGLPVEVVQNYLTIGATWEHCCSEISFFGEYGFKHRVKGRIPGIFLEEDFNRRAPSESDDLNPGDLEFEKWSLAFGIAYGYRF